MDHRIFFSFAHHSRRFTSAKLSVAVALVAGLSSFAAATPEVLAAGLPTSLQALSKPSISKSEQGVICSGFRTVAQGAHLVVTGGTKGGTTYQNGFQLTATASCYERTFGATWQLTHAYTRLTAEVGFDLSNATTCDTDIVRFLGNAGGILPFTAAGKTVDGMYIPKTGLRTATVGLAKQSMLTIQITFVPGTCPAGAVAIDVVNDHLS